MALFPKNAEVDAAALLISLSLAFYLLAAHTYHYVAYLSTNYPVRLRRPHYPFVEFALILTFVILDIVYFVLKYRAHLDASSTTNCTSVTVAYLTVMTVSIWTVELFFLVRGWRILRNMKSNTMVLGIDERSLKIYDVMCRIGIVFVIVCAIATVILQSTFVRYKEQHGVCVPTGQYDVGITVSAVGSMGCAVATGIMGLFLFAKPLLQYRRLLLLDTEEANDDNDGSAMVALRKRSDLIRNSFYFVIIDLVCCEEAVDVVVVGCHGKGLHDGGL